MSVQINYINKLPKKNSQNLVLFVDETFNFSVLDKFISNSEYIYICDLIKINDKKKKIISYDISSKRKII